MRRIRNFTTGLLTCALLLVGCGDDDDGIDADLDPTDAATEQGPANVDPTEGPATTAPADTPSPTPETTATTPTASGEVYEVQSGDTLSGIAQRFDTTVEALVEANGLDDPNALFPGDELTIPATAP